MCWPFYLAWNSQKCKAKIALQMTQRFDWDIVESDNYLNTMRLLTNNTNVFWLPNNPYEILHLNINKIYPTPENTFLIRPYGVSNQPIKSKFFKNKTIIYSNFGVSLIRKALTALSVSIRLATDTFEIHSGPTYGGPHTL